MAARFALANAALTSSVSTSLGRTASRQRKESPPGRQARRWPPPLSPDRRNHPWRTGRRRSARCPRRSAAPSMLERQSSCDEVSHERSRTSRSRGVRWSSSSPRRESMQPRTRTLTLGRLPVRRDVISRPAFWDGGQMWRGAVHPPYEGEGGWGSRSDVSDAGLVELTGRSIVERIPIPPATPSTTTASGRCRRGVATSCTRTARPALLVADTAWALPFAALPSRRSCMRKTGRRRGSMRRCS